MTFEDLLKKYGIDSTRCASGVGEGWFDILDQMFAKLIEAGWNKKLAQVKEKFGTLRVYLTDQAFIEDGKWTKFYEIVSDAEEKSAFVCETCGAVGRMQNTRSCAWWIKTFCDPCFNRRNEERKL